jgi:stage V sporulation protein AD
MSENVKQSKMVGKQTILFQNPPCIISAASIAGKKEGEGPMGSLFDVVCEDPLVGKNSWEEAESELMKQAAGKVLQKAEIS